MTLPPPYTSRTHYFIRERLPHFVLHNFFVPMGRLPLNVLRTISYPISVVIAFLSLRRSYQWDSHLPASFPARNYLILHSTRHLVTLAFEYAWLWHNKNINYKSSLSHFTIGSGEHLLEKHLGKSPVLILGGHFGQWEVLPVALTLRGINSQPPFSGNGLYRLGRHQWVETLLQWRNLRPPFIGFPAGIKGVGELIKRFRSNQFSYLLMDQVPPDGSGDWLTFFGVPANTMRLAGKLSSQKNVQTWFSYTLRNKNGFTLYFDDLTEKLTDCGNDILARNQAINNHLEKRVREHPEAYMWQYQRFKCPKGTKPPQDAL